MPRLIACVNSAGIPGHARTADGKWGFDASEEFPGFVPGGLDGCAAWLASPQAVGLAEITETEESTR